MKESRSIKIDGIILSIILSNASISRSVIEYLECFKLFIEKRLIDLPNFLSKAHKILIIPISNNFSSFSKPQKPIHTTKSF